MAVILVTGPVRSGKSRYVIAIAQKADKRVSYVATAVHDQADGEWNTRLQRHMRDRPKEWDVIESSLLDHRALLDVFHDRADDECIVVDALGTWLAARIATNIDAIQRDFATFENIMDLEAAELAKAMIDCKALVVVVAEEVGWDIVPVAASARLFRDVLGRLKQQLAAEAQDVYLVVCGYALDLHALGVTIS